MTILLCFFLFIQTASASIEGSISGSVQDLQGVALPRASLELINQEGKVIKTVESSETGDFTFFPVDSGDYSVSVHSSGMSPSQAEVHVMSGGSTQVNLQLTPEAQAKSEMVVQVKAKKRMIQNSASVSSTELSQRQIRQLPQGSEVSLPKLLAMTTPGAVLGPFGQLFFRGNHGSIQYQIDGVQLPESPSNTFGQTLSPRNVDHMEVITGGIPAEYGQRLNAVINMVTKSGAEEPGGELELNYGSYNTVSPHLLYGGSNDSGNIRYFFSLNYNRTDRGIDTPQPESENNQRQGGKESIHNVAFGNSEFAKVDWQADNDNKISFIVSNTASHLQIPNYPSYFDSGRPGFSLFQPDYPSAFGEGVGEPASSDHDHDHPTFNYVPSNTNNSQSEMNTFAQVVWKHTFSPRSFFQLAPYYKYSSIVVTNDPVNDLASLQYEGVGHHDNSYKTTTAAGSAPIDHSKPASFAENRHINNLGLKGDYSYRAYENHLFKTGFQLQASRTDGFISIQRDLNAPAYTFDSPQTGYFEGVYIQDDYTIFKSLVLNAGLRYDATQFHFSGENASDSLLQPRVGLNYFASDTTKLHVFYGRLFQPAPVENLRATFNQFDPNPQPYDIKAEKDDYYEAGIDQQIFAQQVASLNVYYKDVVNMLDDAQLLNTSISQPYNLARGYAYGVEFSVRGQINEDWSNYASYSYNIAKGKGREGGAWAAEPQESDAFEYVDHLQIHTANAGVTYSKNYFWGTLQGLYGSGLRTGFVNRAKLPDHFTMDTTVGYEFHGESWLSRFKISGDVLNLFDNRYAITVANGFNGSHYAAGRQFFLRLTKSL